MLTKNLETTNNSKHFLKCRLILVCKYRKKLLSFPSINNYMKKLLYQIVEESDFFIEEMESDEDHVHLLIRYIPRLSIASIVNRLKSLSIIRVWKEYEQLLSIHFWKEHTFWTDGYFVSSIGYTSQETIEKYMQSQG